MQRTYLGNSILYHLGKHAWTQLKLGEATGMRSSSLSEIISKPKRPEATTLRALCNCWPDAESNLRILIEHLRDEMVRAGHAGEGELEFRPSKPSRADIDRDLALLCEEATLDVDVAAIVRDLATLVRRARTAGEAHQPAKPKKRA